MFAMIAMLILMTACARGSGSEGGRLWCNTNHPHFFTETQWASLDRQQRQQHLAHNKYGLKICGRAWAKG